MSARAQFDSFYALHGGDLSEEDALRKLNHGWRSVVSHPACIEWTLGTGVLTYWRGTDEWTFKPAPVTPR